MCFRSSSVLREKATERPSYCAAIQGYGPFHAEPNSAVIAESNGSFQFQKHLQLEAFACPAGFLRAVGDQLRNNVGQNREFQIVFQRLPCW